MLVLGDICQTNSRKCQEDAVDSIKQHWHVQETCYMSLRSTRLTGDVRSNHPVKSHHQHHAGKRCMQRSTEVHSLMLFVHWL